MLLAHALRARSAQTHFAGLDQPPKAKKTKGQSFPLLHLGRRELHHESIAAARTRARDEANAGKRWSDLDAKRRKPGRFSGIVPGRRSAENRTLISRKLERKRASRNQNQPMRPSLGRLYKSRAMAVLAALVGGWGVWRFVVTVAAGILDGSRIPVRHGACRQRTKDDRSGHQQRVDFRKMPHRLNMRCAKGRNVTPRT